MRRTLREMAAEFRRHWPNYVWQSVLATLVLLLALVALRMEHGVIVASLGATAFIVFAMPDSLTAKPRNVVGGHVGGLLCGGLCSLAAGGLAPGWALVAYAAAVGLSIFVMVVTDTEHPPASGTALGIATVQSWRAFAPAALAVVTGAVLLALAHHLLKPYLRDLT